MSDAKRLRAEVEKKLKAVNNKIARTKRTTGANIAGSEFDPRRRSGVEKHYNAKQLSNYLVQLNDFMRRPNQFVAGAYGAPIPKGYFYGVYKKNERAVEGNRKVRDETIGAIQTPIGWTISEFQKLAKTGGASRYGPHQAFDRSPSDVKDFASLQKLNKQLLKRLRPDYIPSEIAKGRNSVMQVAEFLGDDQIANAIDNLSDYEFDLIWFGTTFASRLFMYYDLEKERAEATYKERNQDKVIDSQFAGIGELIQWAKEQTPKEG